MFQGGPTINYTVEFIYVGTDGVLTLRSSSFGDAIGHGSFLTPNSSPDTATACVNGRGVHTIAMTLAIATGPPTDGH